MSLCNFFFNVKRIIDVLNILLLYINAYLNNFIEINAYINFFMGIFECIFKTLVSHICNICIFFIKIFHEILTFISLHIFRKYTYPTKLLLNGNNLLLKSLNMQMYQNTLIIILSFNTVEKV